MKLVFVAISVIVYVGIVAADDETTVAATKPAVTTDASAATTDDGIKIYKRLIPADVLRDFPGMCFASTRCATIQPGHTWELTPFCGRSTCVVGENNKLLELVEDCGPLPLANDKCKLDTDRTNKTASFPLCCPIFVCEDGVKLEYPEIKTETPADKKE